MGEILIPFANPGSTTLWVGLGQVSLYLMGIVRAAPPPPARRERLVEA